MITSSEGTFVAGCAWRTVELLVRELFFPELFSAPPAIARSNVQEALEKTSLVEDQEKNAKSRTSSQGNTFLSSRNYFNRLFH